MTAISPFPPQAEAEFEVLNRQGLHARPAAKVVLLTGRFPGDVRAERGADSVNAKSLMGLMMLTAGRGSRVRFKASGEGAEDLLRAVGELFASKFSEA